LQKKFGTVKLTAIKFYDRVDSDHTYYTYNVPPAVLSSTQKKSESTVFSTEHGVYLVTKSAKNGQGITTSSPGFNNVLKITFNAPPAPTSITTQEPSTGTPCS